MEKTRRAILERPPYRRGLMNQMLVSKRNKNRFGEMGSPCFNEYNLWECIEWFWFCRSSSLWCDWDCLCLYIAKQTSCVLLPAFLTSKLIMFSEMLVTSASIGLYWASSSEECYIVALQPQMLLIGINCKITLNVFHESAANRTIIWILTMLSCGMKIDAVKWLVCPF